MYILESGEKPIFLGNLQIQTQEPSIMLKNTDLREKTMRVRPSGPNIFGRDYIFCVPAVCLSTFILLFLHFSCFFFFTFTNFPCKCPGEHSCMSSKFSNMAMLNETCSLRPAITMKTDCC